MDSLITLHTSTMSIRKKIKVHLKERQEKKGYYRYFQLEFSIEGRRYRQTIPGLDPRNQEDWQAAEIMRMKKALELAEGKGNEFDNNEVKPMLFMQFVRSYLEHSKNVKDRSEVTYKTDHRSFQRFRECLKEKGMLSISLNDITPVIAEMFKSWRLYKVSNNTTRLELRHLKAGFSWAKSNGFIFENPFWNIKFPTEKVSDPKAIPIEDVTKIFEAVKNNKALTDKKRKLIIQTFELYRQTGIRPSELWKINVGRWHGDEITIPRPKTGSERTIVLNDISKSIIEQWAENKAPEDPLFHWFKNPTPTRWFRYYRDLAGVSKEYSLKHFRKTFGRDLHELGHTTEEVADSLGHTSTRITKKYYTGINKIGMKKAVDELGKRKSFIEPNDTKM